MLVAFGRLPRYPLRLAEKRSDLYFLYSACNQDAWIEVTYAAQFAPFLSYPPWVSISKVSATRIGVSNALYQLSSVERPTSVAIVAIGSASVKYCFSAADAVLS